jgi:hypothetical protein
MTQELCIATMQEVGPMPLEIMEQMPKTIEPVG